MLRSNKLLKGERIPSLVAIETVNYCNSKCIFCPLFQGKDQIDRKIRPKTIMSMDLFNKIVVEMASWKKAPQVIYLNMHGEPLLDKKLEERLAVLEKFGLSGLVDLQTNGEFLSREISAALIKSRVNRLTLGFDGATQQTYESHRVGCHYERVLKSIADFVEERKRLRGATRLAIQYVRTKANAHEVAAAYQLFRHLLDPDLDCFQDQVSKNWASKDLEANGIIWEDRCKSDNPIPCPMIDHQIIILADGAIAACCWDYNYSVFGEPLGNAREESLLAIFNGYNFRQLRTILQYDGPYYRPTRCLSCYYLYDRDEPTAGEAAISDPTLITTCNGGYVYAFRHRNIANRLWGMIKRSKLSYYLSK